MPVCIKKLSDLEMLELATSENIQRSDMHPLDEAQAFAQMLTLGSDVDSIALKMGVSKRTVAQRLSLASNLSSNVKEALLNDTISLAQAQQLTTASAEIQDEILDQILSDDYNDWSPETIKDFLQQSLMPVAYALFDVADYRGEITNNLFDEEHQPCFVDTEQAKRLQLEAIEKLRQTYSQHWQWVEVVHQQHFSRWHFDNSQVSNPQEQGVVILIHGDLKVEVIESLLKRHQETSKHTVQDKPKTPVLYTKRLLMECHHVKTRAIQTELLTHHRLCLILNIMGLMGCSEVKMKTELPHWFDFKTEGVEQVTKPHAEALSQALGKACLDYPLTLKGYGINQRTIYEYLKTLSDDDLQNLFDVLTACTFGSWYGFEPQAEDSPLALAIANDLELKMQNHFTLNEDFLKGYRKDGLVKLLNGLGYDQDFSGMTSRGLIAFILSVVKQKPHLPELVQFNCKETTSEDVEFKQAA